ncbi:MAG: conjugal transfer protein TraN [Sulfuricaulis sp.]
MKTLILRLSVLIMLLGFIPQPGFADLPCWVTSKTCTDGPSSKTIAGVSLYRDCWNWSYQYTCGGTAPLTNDCSTLLAQGCSQIGSACAVTATDGTCDIYNQTYQCQAPSTTINVVLCGADMFCLQGGCANKTYVPNQDFAQSYGGLAAVEQASREFDPNNLTVFTGISLQCTYYVLNSYDCCDMNGILNGILSCNQDEQLLAQQRQLKNTVYIGNYCAQTDPVFGTCLETKSTYCDFKSMLARIIQQQGRPQLGLTFGTAQSPDCSGLTIVQFSSLDFNKIDFSEFTNQFAVPSANTTNATTNLQNKLNSGTN